MDYSIRMFFRKNAEITSISVKAVGMYSSNNMI
jgi:hypothetical protein